MISVEKVSVDKYIEISNTLALPSANFMQSGELAALQMERGNFKETECVIFLKEDQVIGHALINYSVYLKVFTHALILNGPVLVYDDGDTIQESLKALERYLKQKRVAIVKVHPYLVDETYTEKLVLLDSLIQQHVVTCFESRQYKRVINRHNNVETLGQMFYKRLDMYENVDDVYQQLSASVKRDIKKAEESCVVIRELDSDELDVFYHIVQETSSRKGFVLQEKSFFERLKHHFGENAKVMAAYLDVAAYTTYLTEQIKVLTERLAVLQERGPGRKTKGHIQDVLDQLGSYEKRYTFLQEQADENQQLIPLSAYFFVVDTHDIVSYAGGSMEEWINLGGSTLLHWHMIQQAKVMNKDFNFYGTIETNDAHSNKGNFNFKRQFGGELQVFVGSFVKVFNPLLKIIIKVLRRG